MPDRILAETPFLRCIDRDGWVFVERPNAAGVVALVAVTAERRLLLVEQHRPAVAREVIELPAGLVGDGPETAGEELEAAARRELVEETGYRAGRLHRLSACASSPGLASEIATFFLATDLERVGPGGGTAEERIRVHEIAIAHARGWLSARAAAGALISAKVYAGLYLAGL